MTVVRSRLAARQGGSRCSGCARSRLRHKAASLWLAAAADPKVVQRVLRHATAAMTMDLYGHLVNANLWQAAQLVGGIIGASEPVFGRRATIRNPGESATASAG